MLPFLSEVAGYTSVPSNPSSYVNTHFTTSASFHSCTDHENTLPIQVTRSFNKLAVFRLESGRTKQLFSTFVSSLLSGHCRPSSSGHCRQAILITLLSGRCCLSGWCLLSGCRLRLSSSGHHRQAVVSRHAVISGHRHQALVVRPSSSRRFCQAIVVSLSFIPSSLVRPSVCCQAVVVRQLLLTYLSCFRIFF